METLSKWQGSLDIVFLHTNLCFVGMAESDSSINGGSHDDSPFNPYMHEIEKLKGS